MHSLLAGNKIELFFNPNEDEKWITYNIWLSHVFDLPTFFDGQKVQKWRKWQRSTGSKIIRGICKLPSRLQKIINNDGIYN